ncbi:MAG: hypothetical protein HC802_16350 [Caldilineaceae bacterium]|nr:hypothetical protein [Caldilineaceae bacterium]
MFGAVGLLVGAGFLSGQVQEVREEHGAWGRRKILNAEPPRRISGKHTVALPRSGLSS